MIQVLLVEVSAAAGEQLLKRLSVLADEWSMRCVVGEAAALAALDRAPADVVITELTGPGFDGVALLRQVRERWPATARFVLSANTSTQLLMKALPVAHQILCRPFDPAQLQRIVFRTCALSARLYSNGVRASLGGLRSLPAVPRLYQLLSQELDSGRATPKSVATIIEQDMSMTARLLQLVNSAFFGLSRRITHIREAVTYLGFEPIRNLVVSSEMFRAMSRLAAPAGFSLDAVQQHSQRVGSIAAGLLSDRELSRTAYCAGMLHDIGRVVLAVSMPEAFSRASELARIRELPLHVAEQQVFACTHAEIGAHLLVLWGLPQALVEAVAFHHSPAALGEPQFGIAGAIHVADAIEHARLASPGDLRPEAVLARIDTDWFARCGEADALPRWLAGVDHPDAAAA
ncbi:MAG: response regulator [Gammaproteobacteria bacterium]|nr:response regulator [Gammaproteobacteria bacterium]